MFTIIEVLTHLDMWATIAAELCTSWFVLPFCFKTVFTLQRIPRLWTSTIKNCIYITGRTKEQRDAIYIAISEKIYFVKTRWHQIPSFKLDADFGIDCANSIHNDIPFISSFVTTTGPRGQNPSIAFPSNTWPPFFPICQSLALTSRATVNPKM